MTVIDVPAKKFIFYFLFIYLFLVGQPWPRVRTRGQARGALPNYCSSKCIVKPPSAWIANLVLKMNIIPILNKSSPSFHTELEFIVLDVSRKLVKHVIYLSKRINWNIKWKFFTQAAQTAINQFLVSKNFRD
jgi:hypothetical protein